MIKLDIEKKCHECYMFECSLCKKGVAERTDVIITCKHKDYCLYLEKEKENDEC